MTVTLDGNHDHWWESCQDIGEIAHAGDWVVNKNSTVPSYVLGADHGLEHANRSMKDSEGLIGIMFNQAARTKFS